MVMARYFNMVVAVLVFGGCSTVQFSYNNSDALLRYMAWDYFDLDADQAKNLQQVFLRLREWHRSSELPAYVGLLKEAADKVSKGATTADVEWAAERLREHYRIAARRAAQDAASILVTLTADQIGSLEKKLAKEDVRYFERWLSGGENALQRRRSERMVEQFEEWTGSLDATQRFKIANFISLHSSIYELRLLDRRRWQREAVALIKRYRSVSELTPLIERLVVEPESGRSEQYVLALRRWEADLAGLIVELDATLRGEQRRRVLMRMDKYAEDFRVLSGIRRQTERQTEEAQRRTAGVY